MLFLGAGASKAFSIPTMTTFVDEILNSLSATKIDADRKMDEDRKKQIEEWENAILQIRHRIERKSVRPDIETVLTALTILSDTSTIKNYLAPFNAISDINIEAREDLASLIYEIRRQIYKKCMEFDANHASKVYGKLCTRLNKNNVYRVVFDRKEGGEMLSPVSPPITNNVYTTNYDPVYETALKLNDINYCDGFIQDHSELVFGNFWYDKMVQLAKLHGSIDYYLRPRDDMVVKHSLPVDENQTDISGDKLQRMMILPIGEKYVTRTPYLEFLQKLRKDLRKEEIVIVIGFRFRDDPITNAFIDSVSERRRIKMIVVAPQAKNIIINNLPEKLQKISVAVDSCFGDDASIESICHAVVDRPCDEY